MFSCVGTQVPREKSPSAGDSTHKPSMASGSCALSVHTPTFKGTFLTNRLIIAFGIFIAKPPYPLPPFLLYLSPKSILAGYGLALCFWNPFIKKQILSVS